MKWNTELSNNDCSGTSFTFLTRYACAIPDLDGHSVVLAGGGFDEDASKKVSRYDLQGFVEDMPELTVGRMDLGCGSYWRDDGTQVICS